MRVGVPTYANHKVFEFHIDVTAPRDITTKALGTMPALAVHPSTRLDGRDYAVGEGVVWVSGPARVPVRLDGWIRTAQSSFLVHGLRAVLVRYVAERARLGARARAARRAGDADSGDARWRTAVGASACRAERARRRGPRAGRHHDVTAHLHSVIC